MREPWTSDRTGSPAIPAAVSTRRSSTHSSRCYFDIGRRGTFAASALVGSRRRRPALVGLCNGTAASRDTGTQRRNTPLSAYSVRGGRDWPASACSGVAPPSANRRRRRAGGQWQHRHGWRATLGQGATGSVSRLAAKGLMPPKEASIVAPLDAQIGGPPAQGRRVSVPVRLSFFILQAAWRYVAPL